MGIRKMMRLSDGIEICERAAALYDGPPIKDMGDPLKDICVTDQAWDVAALHVLPRLRALRVVLEDDLIAEPPNPHLSPSLERCPTDHQPTSPYVEGTTRLTDPREQKDRPANPGGLTTSPAPHRRQAKKPRVNPYPVPSPSGTTTSGTWISTSLP